MVSMVSVSARTRRSVSNLSYSPGFYRRLNDQSTTDDYQHSSSTFQTLQIGSGDMPVGCFSVERLVSKRKYKVSSNVQSSNVKQYNKIKVNNKIKSILRLKKLIQGRTEYLVLWEGYPREEPSWVLTEDITAAAIM